MDDITTLQLTKQTTQDINNVCLYLQITTLVEIINHSKTPILPEFFYPPGQHHSTANASGSQLEWPVQPCSGTHVWKAWQQTIGQLYTWTNSLNLHQPLGEWLAPTLHKDWNWTWMICPTTLWLFQWQLWISYQPTQNKCSAIYYEDSYNQCTIPPTNAIPVTPTQALTRNITIQKPIGMLVHLETNNPRPKNYLILALMTPTKQWEAPHWTQYSCSQTSTSLDMTYVPGFQSY